MQTRISCLVIVCLLATVEELYDLHAYWLQHNFWVAH
jgi:hypothetical protein